MVPVSTISFDFKDIAGIFYNVYILNRNNDRQQPKKEEFEMIKSALLENSLKYPGVEIFVEPHDKSKAEIGVEPTNVDVYVVFDDDSEKKWKIEENRKRTQILGLFSTLKRTLSDSTEKNVEFLKSLIIGKKYYHNVAQKKEMHKHSEHCSICQVFKNTKSS